MSGIRTLADELRESIKNDKGSPVPKAKKNAPPPKTTANTSLEKLLAAMQDFELAGQEKLLIRLDERTVFLMKQLKVARSIDMNKLIAFCLQDFFRRHPELIQYIKDNIKTIEL